MDAYEHQFNRAVADSDSAAEADERLTKVFEDDFRLALLEENSSDVELNYDDIERIVQMAAASFENVIQQRAA